MVRFLIFVALVAAVIWYAYFRTSQHAGEQPAPSAEGTPVEETQPAPVSAPTPAPTFETYRVSLAGLAQAILGPIESKSAIPQGDAGKKLQDLKTVLSGYASHPDYPRTMQACALLQQALAERTGFIERARMGTTATGLDKVPGQWVIKDTGLNPGANKSVDINARGEKSRASFFASAAYRQWTERSNYYRPLLGRLLTPSI